MILIKKTSSNLLPLTLRERGSSANQVLTNYINTGYINIGYFLTAQVSDEDFVFELKSNTTKEVKALLLKGLDDATAQIERYNLWVMNEVPLAEEDLANYKINLAVGTYDYRVINSVDEVVESGSLKVFSDTIEDQFEVVTQSNNDDTPFVFK